MVCIIYNLPHNIQNLKDNVNIFRHTLKKFIISNTFYSIDEYISSKILLDKWMYCFVIIDDVPTIFCSSNGVQMSLVILNLFVIVVDSIVSLQSSFFMTSSISGLDRTTDQWNYELCMYVSWILWLYFISIMWNSINQNIIMDVYCIYIQNPEYFQNNSVLCLWHLWGCIIIG
jgi:hypothetical protein